MTERFLPFEGIANFRDAGGYETGHGQRVKWRVLFRSGHLRDGTDRDGERLRRLGIGEIHDFRRSDERSAYPTPALPNATTLLYGLRMGSTRGFFDLVIAGDATRERTHGMMVAGYRDYIAERQNEFGQLLRHMARSADHAVLMHCTAGKDRTGIGIALTLLALGVSRETILEDYLLSSIGYPADDVVAILEGFLRERQVPEWDREALVPYCGVHADFLNGAFDEIDRLGGTERYLREQLGLSDQDRDLLRRRFLED